MHAPLLKKFSVSLALSASLFVHALSANAAQIVVESPPQMPVAGETFTVSVTLDTQGEFINALDGVIRYPSTLTLQHIQDGNSVLTFWIERPREENGGVRFSGITPGAFNGKRELFTLVFKAVQVSTEPFTLSEGHALVNDGKGTATRLSLSGASGTTAPLIENDHTPPDAFTLAIANDPALFDGQSFLVFATQDKESGIDHYEVAESRGLQWFGLRSPKRHSAASPYLLTDQTLRSYVYVQAIDKAGNKMFAKLSPTNARWYESDTAILAILLVVILAILIYVRKQKVVRKI
jgi:hypothetical protein